MFRPGLRHPRGVCNGAMRGAHGSSRSPLSDLRDAPLNLTAGGVCAARKPAMYTLSEDD